MVVRRLCLDWVWIGIRRSGTSIRALIDGAPGNCRRSFRHLIEAIAGLAVWLAIGAGLTAVPQPTAGQLRGLQTMLPKSALETTAWIGLAISTRYCVEIIYRGYLLQQLRSLTRSTLGAIVLQAKINGMAHVSLPLERLYR